MSELIELIFGNPLPVALISSMRILVLLPHAKSLKRPELMSNLFQQALYEIYNIGLSMRFIHNGVTATPLE